MTSIQVLDVKKFMKCILLDKVFDEFNVYKLEINSFCNFTINGMLNRDYYTIEEKEILSERKYAAWPEIKPFAYQIIKGNKTPIYMSLIFMAQGNMLSNVIDKCIGREGVYDVGGFFINVRYNNKELQLISSASMRTFINNKIIDEIWDNKVVEFLRENGIT